MTSSENTLSRPGLPLFESPGEDWDSQYEQVMQDSFLQKKYDREVRLSEKWEYLHERLPRLTKPFAETDSPEDSGAIEEKGLVLDLGPGPGEFLEWCRYFGYRVQGVDAAAGENGMGNAYLSLSRLMTQRQGIPIQYCGFREFIERDDCEIEDGSVACINSQGSIEQACGHLMEGTDLHEHHDCRQMTWRSRSETEEFFVRMLQKFERWLMPGGEIIIYANGAANTKLYERAIEKAAKQAKGLQLVHHQNRLHKWSKVPEGSRVRRPFFMKWAGGVAATAE